MPAYTHVISLTDEQYARLHKLMPEDTREHRKFLDTFIDSALSQAETLRALLGSHFSDHIKTTDYTKYGDILRKNDKLTNDFDQEQIRKQKSSAIELKDYEFAVMDETVFFRKTALASDFWPNDVDPEFIKALTVRIQEDKLDLEEMHGNLYVLFPAEAPDYVMNDKEIIESLKFYGLRHVEIDGSEPSSP